MMDFILNILKDPGNRVRSIIGAGMFIFVVTVGIAKGPLFGFGFAGFCLFMWGIIEALRLED